LHGADCPARAPAATTAPDDVSNRPPAEHGLAYAVRPDGKSGNEESRRFATTTPASVATAAKANMIDDFYESLQVEWPLCFYE
jgi:hypothetical protein